MKYLYNTQTKLFLRKCSRVAHTTNVVCLVINVITDLMHPALTLFTLYALKCVLVFTKWVFLETKCTHLDFHVLQFLCSGFWQISPFTMNFPFFLCGKEALLLLIQLCFQVLMVRSNDRQSLSHWYCRSNVLQCHAYTLRKLSCNGGAHFLRHSVEGVLLSVPNVFQTELCLHLSCCVIPSCCDKGMAWASSLARSLWFHCSLSRAFGDKRASSIASQPWFCVLLGLSVSTVFLIPTLCHSLTKPE